MPNMLRRFTRWESEILPEVRHRLAGGGCFLDSRDRDSGQNLCKDAGNVTAAQKTDPDRAARQSTQSIFSRQRHNRPRRRAVGR